MLGVDTRIDVDGGAIFETTHERSPARLFVVHRSRWPLATRSGRGRPPSEGFPDDGMRGSEASTMPGVDARVEQRQHREVCALGDGSKAPGKRPPDHVSGSSPPSGRDEAPARRLLLREHGIFGCCAGGMARPPCSPRTAGAGRAP